MADTLLSVHDLQAWYGQSHVLQGVSLEVQRGEIVSILGRNGAGRSTLLKALMGLVRSSGDIRFAGAGIAGLPTHAIARRGMAYVPESRDVFPTLSVAQNLLLGRQGARQPADAWREEEVYELFPALARRRRGAQLVGELADKGVLALGRALLLSLIGQHQQRALASQWVAPPAQRLRLRDQPAAGRASRIAQQLGWPGQPTQQPPGRRVAQQYRAIGTRHHNAKRLRIADRAKDASSVRGQQRRTAGAPPQCRQQQAQHQQHKADPAQVKQDHGRTTAGVKR